MLDYLKNMPLKQKLGWVVILLFCGSVIFLGVQTKILRELIENETCESYCYRKQFGNVTDIINISATLPDETVHSGT